MKPPNYLLLFGLLLGCFILSAQDDAEEYLNLSEDYYWKSQLDSAEYFGLLTLEQGKKAKSNHLIFEAYHLLSKIAREDVKFQKGDSLLLKALDHAKQDTQKIKAYITLSTNHLRMNQLESAWKYLQLVESFGADNIPFHILRDHKTNLALYYRYKNDLPKTYKVLKSLLEHPKLPIYYKVNLQMELATLLFTLQLYEESLQLLTNHPEEKAQAYEQDPPLKLYMFYTLLDFYTQTKDFKKNVQIGKDALAYSNEISYFGDIGYAYSCLGEAYHQLGQLDSAIIYFNQGIDSSLKQNERTGLVYNYTGLSLLYYDYPNYKMAKKYGELAIQESSFQSLYSYDLMTNLAKIYEQEGNYKEAHRLLAENNKNKKVEDSLKVNLNLITTIFKEQLENQYYGLKVHSLN